MERDSKTPPPEYDKNAKRRPRREDSGRSDSRDSGRSDRYSSGRSDSRDSGRSDNRGAGRPDRGGYGRSDSRDSGRSDNRGYGRSDNRDSGRSDNRGYGRSDSRDSGRPDGRDSGRPDNRNSDRPYRGGGRPDRHGPKNFDRAPRPKRDFFDRRPQVTYDPDAPTKAEVVSKHRFDDVVQLDARILQLIEERSILLKREGSWRRSKNKSLVDPKLEKELRAAFEKNAGLLGLDAKLSRQLFALENQFALADKRQIISEDGYKLAPRVERITAAIKGPRSFRLTRLWQAMATVVGAPVTLNDVTLNAPNKDMAKALKQLGAKVSWDDGQIILAKSEPLAFENGMVFVGDEKFNFYILLALALGHAGRCKFTGKPSLQMLDLGPLSKALPQLGGRVVAMNPNNPGLPARLECGGIMEEEFSVAGLDPLFIPALVFAAWTYAGGLTIKHIPESVYHMVDEALSVLTECGIEASRDGSICTVSDGIPVIPTHPELPLDIELITTLLSLPAFSGGRIAVEGPWPTSETTDIVMSDLQKMGLEITQEDGSVISQAGRLPESIELDMSRMDSLCPTALALGVMIGNATLNGKPDEVAIELLERLGATYTAEEDKITLVSGKLAWEYPWNSPDPKWSMACALVAYRCPGILLDNHGEVTQQWPEFWNFYNSLPTGEMKPRPEKEESPDVTRRRVRVR